MSDVDDQVGNDSRSIKYATAWWFLTAAVPVWIGLSVAGFSITFGSLLGVVVLLFAWRGPRRFRWTPMDALMAALVATAILSALLGGARSIASDSVLSWGVPFVLMRMLSLRMTESQIVKMIVRVGVVFGIWAVLEFALGLHVYQSLATPFDIVLLRDIWQSIQLRDGLSRSEASFGTSITLAAFLAMAMPFALRLSGWRVVATSAVLVAGALATLSRTGGLTLVIAVALVVILRQQKYRVPLVFGGLVLAWAALPLVLGQGVSSTAAADFEQSSAYRDFVFQTALEQSQLIGRSTAYYISVDNAYLRFALTNGLILTAALVALVAYSLYALLKYRYGPALIAFVTMSVAMYVVALITQWEQFVFAMAGIAATEIQRARTVHRSRPRKTGRSVRPGRPLMQ